MFHLPVIHILGGLAFLAMWVDATAIQLVHRHLTPTLHAFFGDLSGAADARFYAIPALGGYGAGLVAVCWPKAHRWKPHCERLLRASLLMLLTLLSGGLITLMLKHAVARARPWLLLEVGYYGIAEGFAGAPFNSFPSSHAFTAFAVACVATRLQPAWRVPLLVAAGTIGVCRVLTLEHFPSDVVASAFIAARCTAFWAARVLNETSHWPLRAPWRWHRSERPPQISTGRSRPPGP